MQLCVPYQLHRIDIITTTLQHNLRGVGFQELQQSLVVHVGDVSEIFKGHDIAASVSLSQYAKRSHLANTVQGEDLGS